ncbi:MAG: hypothetical protein R3E68_19410 [Burkholderiaceae bacterium]
MIKAVLADKVYEPRLPDDAGGTDQFPHLKARLHDKAGRIVGEQPARMPRRWRSGWPLGNRCSSTSAAPTRPR